MDSGGLTTCSGNAAGLVAPGQPRILGRMKLEDSALMMRYKEGDLNSFQELYERHRGGLYRYFLRQVRDPDTASDLFQDVWSKIIRYRANYRPIARFNTYLYRIAHTTLMDYGRGRMKHAGTTSLSDGVAEPAADQNCTPGSRAEGSEAAARLRQALNEIPAEQRDCFLLRHEAGLGLEDIASVTGVSRETAKSRLRYAVKKLRGLLDEEDMKTEKVS